MSIAHAGLEPSAEEQGHRTRAGTIRSHHSIRVLAISNSPHVGGGNRSLVLLGAALAGRGIAVHVVGPKGEAVSEVFERESLAYESHPADQPSWREPRLTWESYRGWRRVIGDRETSLIHANDVMTARSISIAAWRANVPLVCHVRFPIGPAAIQWAFRWLPKPAAFIFNSHALQSECGGHVSRACPQAQQAVIHNAVELERFRPRPKQAEQRRVGILANLLPVKGHGDFLEMARILTDRGTDAEYWVIGDDVLRTGYGGELRRTAASLGVQDSVCFLGHRSDVPNLLNELDVVVCASHVEPFGRCLIEAMACEKPVVATRVGGIPEVVEDGVTGMLVSPHSPEQLADAVQGLLDDSALRERMGRAGRSRVEAHFSAEAHMDRVLNVYHSLMNGC